jgi:integrase
MKRPIEPLTKEEALALLDACSGRPTGVRDKALIAVLWRSQLRIGEALALGANDFEGDRIRVHNGKGGKSRVVGVDKPTRVLIRQWLEIRPTSEYLFCTMRGTQIDTSHYRRKFKQLQQSTGVTRRCHPHGMRHTGAAELAKEKVPLLIISEQLGHSNVATTDRYVRHLVGDEVVKVISKREW